MIWQAVLSITYKGSLVLRFLWQQWRQQWLQKFHIWLIFPLRFLLFAIVCVVAGMETWLQVSMHPVDPENKNEKKGRFYGPVLLGWDEGIISKKATWKPEQS